MDANILVPAVGEENFGGPETPRRLPIVSHRASSGRKEGRMCRNKNCGIRVRGREENDGESERERKRGSEKGGKGGGEDEERDVSLQRRSAVCSSPLHRRALLGRYHFLPP